MERVGGSTLFNPFPFLFTLNVKRISDRVPTSSRSPGDRPRTILGRVWTGTMDYHPKIPTARRRARSLGLGSAPESPVGDVPTAPCASL